MHTKATTKVTINTHHYPLSDDLIDSLAKLLTQNFSPDLTRVTVLLNNINRIQDCRNSIIKSANEIAGDGANDTNTEIGIIGPKITTLSLWAKQHSISQDKKIIDPRLQELMLVEALLEHKQLYHNANPWTLADSMLNLFNQLSTQSSPLPENIEQFEQHLSGSYGLEDTNNPYLSDEALLIHRLWHAMQQQLSSTHYLDHATSYRQQLENSLTNVTENSQFYFVGYLKPNAIEKDFINALAQRCEVHIVSYQIKNDFFKQNSDSTNSIDATHSNVETPPAIGQLFDYIYQSNDQPLHTRRKQCLQHFPQSPLSQKIKLYCAHDRENEAQAIQQQIRLWLHGGKANIGFVTNNRKLARRVRALLERHNIELTDDSGWNLSTSSSAALLEQWLQCIDNDYHYLPLLDLLKSPYLFPEEDREQRLKTVYRFENQIILHENVSSNIQRYIDAITYRQKRLPDHLSGHLNSIAPLLQRIEHSAKPLIALAAAPHSPQEFLNVLWQSMQQLGILSSFANDAAGQQIIHEIETLRRAAAEVDIKIEWVEFRAWLGHKFEQQQFQTNSLRTNVQIVSLQQTTLSAFDAVVIGSAERQFMPTNASQAPFFNNTVRKNLGLEGDEESKNIEFILFRHLLEHASTQLNVHQHQPPLLITHTGMVNDEEIQASAWLELLSTHHQYFYGDSLYSAYLQDYIDQQQQLNPSELQTQAAEKAAVQIQDDMLPSHFSASSYQQLMDCPYQFYVARSLKLQPPEQIREYLQKSDYGELVHLVLQAFHSDLTDMPGPFQHRVNADNSQQALETLKEISLQVFKQHIENNFAHHAWLNQWLSITPTYIEWLIERQIDWQIDEVEKNIDKLVYRRNVQLKARLDRIDKQQDKLSIIDYKTGLISSKENVLNGEAVQLPFYALSSSCAAEQDLNQRKVIEAAYLSLGSDGVRLKNIIADETLTELQQKTGERLITLVDELRNGTSLVAWGDDTICSYCTAAGICRKQYRNQT